MGELRSEGGIVTAYFIPRSDVVYSSSPAASDGGAKPPTMEVKHAPLPMMDLPTSRLDIDSVDDNENAGIAWRERRAETMNSAIDVSSIFLSLGVRNYW